MALKEETFFEGGPHTGDLVVNSLVGATIIGLPLFVGSLVRKVWVKYRITSRRITVIGGWGGKDRSDVIYSEIAKVVIVPRLGGWGDMVLTLKDGSRLELRSLPRFREIYDYINQRIDEKAQQVSGAIGQKTVTRPAKTRPVPLDPSDPGEIEAKEPLEEVDANPRVGFTDYAETLNGRLAMIGFLTLLALELVTHKTLIELITGGGS